MTRLEWWYGIERGFVAYAELLQETFTTQVAGHPATVHLPSVNADETEGMGWLAAPRIGGRPATPSKEHWGMVHIGTKAKPVGVVIKQLALTADIPAGIDPQQAAQSLVDAMDDWWENVRGWLELVTGQHLTRVGHKETEVIGNKTPIWSLRDDDTHDMPFSMTGVSSIYFGRQVEAVTADILNGCVSLADNAPPLAWTLLRDARALEEVGHYRRAVIDAATSAELAVSEILDARLGGTEESVRNALLAAHRMLGAKSKLLTSLNCPPLPSSFESDLVVPRNNAVHKGISIDGPTCNRAISVAAEVVERAFPLPVPPAVGIPLRRLW
jgi:hypothetical protein